MHRLALAIVASSVAACTSTYHPEYHPVTATTITQTYSGGAVLSSGPAAQRPVFVAPTASPPVVIQAPPLADPDAFFDTSYR